MKNRKGFTLVELLAVIVILGILLIFSVPIITGMLDRSRNKIYVDDAKKLISQAEYQMRKSSNDIDVPDPGDCILISLVYLDSSEFDNPPNKGEYLKENSFVVVKNEGGKLKYSATIVEKYSGSSYKGVELTTSEVLYSSSAIRHVKSFKESDLKKVDENVDVNYLKEKLGDNYLSDGSITAIYNYPSRYNGNALNDDSFAPKILKASIDSPSTYNSLNATLTLNVKDDDTPKSKLDVYISYTDYTNNNPIPYGNSEQFTHNINFSDLGFNYDNGGEATVYIVVKDPEGNFARKKLTYQIQKNKAPEINNEKSYISKRGSDAVNMTTALVTFSVSDDISTLDKLKVCLNESSSNEIPTTCGEYKNYNEVFSSSNTLEYTFKNCPTGTCSRDGSTHYLNIFVQDERGLTTSKQFAYTFSTNQAPTINSVKVISNSEPFTDDHSKNVRVEVDAKDDLDTGDKLNVVISDGTKSVSHKYSTNPDNNSFKFTFDGNYDGSVKNVVVTVTDSEGLSSTMNASPYTIYNNVAPVIRNYKVTSSENVCTNVNVCGDVEGGNKKVNIELSATDDIDYADNYAALKVCVSENESDCNSDSNYLSYKDHFYNKTYSKTLSGSYDGSVKTIYVKVKDTYGVVSSSSVQYKMYENMKPVITDFEIESKENDKIGYGNKETTITLNAEDDFDDENEVMVTISGGGSTLHDTLANIKNSDYTISGDYDGSVKTITVTVTDSLGLTDTKTIEYELYKNEKPLIDNISIKGNGNPCTNEFLCKGDMEIDGNYDVKYSINAVDEVDDVNDLKICVSENISDCDNDSNYNSYADYIDGITPKKIDYTFLNKPLVKPYTGDVKKLNFCILDTMGGKTCEEASYTIYNNNGPVITEEPSVITNGNNKINIPNVKFTISAIDDFDSDIQIKYCKKIDDIESCTEYMNYEEEHTLGNDFFGSNKNDGKTYEIYAYLKDDYGTETKSSSIDYTLYQDASPIVYLDDFKGAYTDVYFDGDREVSEEELENLRVYYDDNEPANPIDKDGNILSNEEVENRNNQLNNYTLKKRVRVSFRVQDYYDTYKVCINTDANSCSDYSSVDYDGNDMSTHTYVYDYYSDNYPTGVDKDGNIIPFEFYFYLFVKDSYGNVVNMGSNSLGEVTQDRLKINVYEYIKCNLVDQLSGIYQFMFDASKEYKDEKGNVVTNNQPITIDRCDGKCYYDEDTNNIVSYYDQKITYKDAFDSSVSCDKDMENKPYIYPYKANCSFKDCFYKNNNYKRKVIGTKLYVGENNPWIVTINDKTYECNGYYKLYSSSYNDGDPEIVLTEILNERICPEAVNDHVYDYNSASNDPYVRISES